MHELKARFPEGVRNYLSARAKDNDRSMNAELINILKKVMKEDLPNASGIEPATKAKQGTER